MNKIVNFHVVSDIRWFERIIVFLKNNYKMVSIDAVHNYMLGNAADNNMCHITVDDGDISFYQNIFPVLKKHNISASLFVSPKICSENKNFWFQEIAGYDKAELLKIFSDVTKLPFDTIKRFGVEMLLKSQAEEGLQDIIRRYQTKMNVRRKFAQNMSVKNLQEVSNSGLVTIGAHTINHPILKNENDADSQMEICESVFQLSDILKKKISYFAYPNGIYGLDFSDREFASLKKADVDLAFTTESKNFVSTNHKYRVPRIGISDNENFLLFRAKMLMSAHWETITKFKSNNECTQRRRIQNLLKHSN